MVIQGQLINTAIKNGIHKTLKVKRWELVDRITIINIEFVVGICTPPTCSFYQDIIIIYVTIDNYSISFKRIIIFKIIDIRLRNFNIHGFTVFYGANKLAVDIDIIGQKRPCKCSFSKNIKPNKLNKPHLLVILLIYYTIIAENFQ